MKKHNFLLTALILSMTLILTACTDGSGTGDDPDAPVVIEPGINGNANTQNPDEPSDADNPDTPDAKDEPVVFIDKGEATTIEDLAKAQSMISSYYFEQDIPYPDGSIFVRAWYCDGKMKVITSQNGYIVSEDYYDYNAKTWVAHSPGGSSAQEYSFDPSSANAPANPIADDYLSYTYIESETIDRQLCLVLETGAGDKLWVSTKYGFPLQVEFNDSFGARYTVQYRNIEINTITTSDVAVPTGLL